LSTRTNLRPYPVIGALATAHGLVDSGVSGSMSGTGAIASLITILQGLTAASYTFSWTGSSPVGSIQIFGSNDYSINIDGKTAANSGTWTPIYFSVNGGAATNTLNVTGNSGSGIVELSTGLYAVKCIYTNASGTGTLTAVIGGKVY